MVTLHLVRHAAPRIDRSAPAWEWGLAPSAAEAARRLRDADALSRDALWVSSSEPKAVLTAHLLTDRVVHLDGDLREAVRTPEFFDLEGFRTRVLRSFGALDVPAAAGWEALTVTQTRVVHAARRAVAEAAGQDVVLTSHGTALTMLVAGLTDEPPDVGSWMSMRMPDHCSLALSEDPVPRHAAEIVTGWGAWAT